MASDLSNVSANMLFGEQPSIIIPELDDNSSLQATQDRLEYILSTGDVYSRLLEAAEEASALGGVYLKIDWDKEFIDVPMMNVCKADYTLPVFRWGFLQEVTFFKIVKIESYQTDNIYNAYNTESADVYYRLVENREKGVIRHALYKGTCDNIGYTIPLATLEETQHLVGQEEVFTGIDDLLVRYIPNITPNRLFRDKDIGRSDYLGSEWLLNALDTCYTSWIRDIRLGQSRIMIPETWLERTDPSNGGTFTFDVDREIFTTLDIDPASGQTITLVQFAIRVEEHMKTALDYIQRICSSAGFSPQSFGINADGQAESGTALNVKERKSINTKSKKEIFFKASLEEICELLLLVDSLVFNSGVEIVKPVIEFKDSLAFDTNRMADTIEKLYRAQAISTKTKVQMIHPDWSNEKVMEETDKILEETGISNIDVTTLP